jgi:hypothetical protein
MSDITNLDNLDDIDALLDKNLDDIADLPSFATWPLGIHKATITWARKDIEKKPKDSDTKVKTPHMELTMVYMETLELVNQGDVLPAPGDKMNTAYDLTNEFSMGALKKAIKTLGESIGQTSAKEIIKGTNGFEVAIVLKHRKDKIDKDKIYPQIEDMIPA